MNIENMKNMSIDDIVKLYQDGYKIETMQYGTYCSGTPTLDRSNTNGSRELSVQIYTAFGQKIKPASKCLANVVLRLAIDSANPNDMFVEIRESDPSTGLPRGDPNSPNYQLGFYRIPESSLQRYPSFSDITIPLNILLSDSHITNGVWIVVFMYIYDPTRTDSYPYGYIKEDTFGTSNEYFAAKSGLLSWEGSTSINLYFKTNKQTYSVPSVLTTITISPTTATVNIGQTQQFTAVCKDQNNVIMTCPTLTWNSSNTAAATISGTGLLTGASTGTTNVTASAAGVTSNIAAVTVTTPTPILTTITLSPPSVTLSPGSIQTFIATCKDQNGNTMTCPALIWSSDNTSIGTITQTGVFTAVAGGTTMVRATSGTVVGTASVTVTTVTPILTSITISPSTTSVAPGDTKTFTATPKDQFGGVMTGITITWSVDNTAIGTISPSIGPTTTFTGAAEGSTTIRAISGTVVGTAIITVTTAPPAAGAGGALVIAAVAAIGIIYFMMRRPPSPPK